MGCGQGICGGAIPQAAVPEAAQLDYLIDTVRVIGASEVMLRYLKVAHSRKDDGSLFTEADLATQKALIRELQRIEKVPVLAEEMTEAEQAATWAAASQSGLWCVDPIDGTTNFVSGLPHFGISVALIRGGRPVLGVVYDPVCDEAFAAALGAGATLNGERLPIKPAPEMLSRCVAGIDFKRLDTELAVQLVRTPPYASQRNIGASALDWCYLAAGRLHIYIHGGQKLWDYAAGSLILSEAGGCAETLAGTPHWQVAPGAAGNSVMTASVLAGLSSGLQQQLRTWMNATMGSLAAKARPA